MHEIKAIIRSSRLNSVMEALHEIPSMSGVTVSRVHAYARRRSDVDGTAAPGLQADFMKLETVVPSSLVEHVVETIRGAPHTGGAGDGMIFVSAVQEAVRVRNGARNLEAL